MVTFGASVCDVNILQINLNIFFFTQAKKKKNGRDQRPKKTSWVVVTFRVVFRKTVERLTSRLPVQWSSSVIFG